MRPIRTTDECDHFDKLVAEETRHGRVMSQQMRGEEVTKLHPLGGVNRQPFICHKVL